MVEQFAAVAVLGERGRADDDPADCVGFETVDVVREHVEGRVPTVRQQGLCPLRKQVLIAEAE
ncbi:MULTISPECIES: hypothetical protein [unclassified Streptomyces]|uniref:hypothetical protein n=1 Tax=unclassified Streptomyces TaxID=2593676 RepID=UPI0018EA1428|nr:hypothetical protein [Streptomyces sp. TSRI0281]